MEGEGCSYGSLYVASLPWSIHSSHNAVLYRICVTSLDVTSIGPDPEKLGASKEKKGMN